MSIEQRWSGKVRVSHDGARLIQPDLEVLPAVCQHLVEEAACCCAGLVVEEQPTRWELRWLFYCAGEWTHVVVDAPLTEKQFPSISSLVHAADWHEREAEDMFGLKFEGHPRLGDFILHDEEWQEGLEPMRRGFDPRRQVSERRPDENWQPRRIVQAPGAFLMPIGPVFGAGHEAVHFLLETVGEDVIRAIPRLFYKYRAVEKMAEGCPVDRVLLLAERFSATTALAHALGFCRAVEQICGVQAPPRARRLRILLAELERLRHHLGAIAAVCSSTGLAVAAAQASILEEELLRLCGSLTGHRYLFGLTVPGGLTRDLDGAACRQAVEASRQVLERLQRLERMLVYSSSFLDRLEEVGTIRADDANAYGLVGPVARASGGSRDLRALLPYGHYGELEFAVATEQEGDGYARLRVLFAESVQAVELMSGAIEELPEGAVAEPPELRAGAALGWVEAPRGAALHWVRLAADGSIDRYHIMPPSFANWHGLHLAVEDFAFQDFPIILATMDLSVAENDR